MSVGGPEERGVRKRGGKCRMDEERGILVRGVYTLYVFTNDLHICVCVFTIIRSVNFMPYTFSHV